PTCSVLLNGCAQPLGPGFRFADRHAEIQAIPEAPAKVHVRVTDRLENVGNRPLSELAAQVSLDAGYRAQNLRVSIDGHEAAVRSLSNTDARLTSAPFERVWKEKETREIIAEMDLLPTPDTRGSIAVSAAAF